MKPSQSYFLIDLMGGGVLTGTIGTQSLLKSTLASFGSNGFQNARGDSEMIRGVEFAYGLSIPFEQ